MDKPAVPPPKPAAAAPVPAETATPACYPCTIKCARARGVLPRNKKYQDVSIGSLRDRITALQSVPMPGVPGRAPPRLPKKTPTSEEEIDDARSPADDVATPSSEVAIPVAEPESTLSTPSAGVDGEEEDPPANVDEPEELEEQAEPTEEEKELQRRQALAQRMAALGGARIGLAPLPKRAAPPKATTSSY